MNETMNDKDDVFTLAKAAEKELYFDVHKMMTVVDPVSFDWSNKWLKGEEYFHILSNIDRYCETFDLKKFQNKTHPPCIYTEPQSNILTQMACFTS